MTDSGQCFDDAFEIITCADDSRCADLIRLCESIKTVVPDTPVSIIPFTDQLDKVKFVSDIYDASLIERDPLWDSVGKALYADESYRPSVPMFGNYFRKLKYVQCKID